MRVFSREIIVHAQYMGLFDLFSSIAYFENWCKSNIRYVFHHCQSKHGNPWRFCTCELDCIM